jgi:hypothetical protein
MTVLGYARVSTMGQELDIQVAQLKAAGCQKILFEKESGAKDKRRELSRLLRLLRKGDVVVVPALDRLTRGGPFKMLSLLADITARGATYRSLASLGPTQLTSWAKCWQLWSAISHARPARTSFDGRQLEGSTRNSAALNSVESRNSQRFNRNVPWPAVYQVNASI